MDWYSVVWLWGGCGVAVAVAVAMVWCGMVGWGGAVLSVWLLSLSLWLWCTYACAGLPLSQLDRATVRSAS